MSEYLQKPTKKPYEKPNMVTETLEAGSLAYAGSPVCPSTPPPNQALVGQVQPFFGLCCG